MISLERTDKLARTLFIASDDYDYVYDPKHMNRPHDGKRWFRTPMGWSTYESGKSSGKVPDKFREVRSEKFAKAIREAKESHPRKDKWRVDAHPKDDYIGCRCFVTKGGSCVAVTPKRDIISVCKMEDSEDHGSELLKKAVELGGDRLDAFGKNLYCFYTKNGFEPVAVTAFNPEYAPEYWEPKEDDKEPIVFYRYIGKPYNGMTFEEFVGSHEPMEYDEATEYRDNLIDKQGRN